MSVLVAIIGCVICSCIILALFPRTRCFYEETGSPLVLAFSGVLLGMLLQQMQPLKGIAIITAIVLVAVVRWLIGRGGHLFHHSKPSADA